MDKYFFEVNDILNQLKTARMMAGISSKQELDAKQFDCAKDFSDLEEDILSLINKIEAKF